MLRIYLLCGKYIIMIVPRYLEKPIRSDLVEKMVFLSGPRQVGKTTLARVFLMSESDLYYNWDRREDRREILSARWPADKRTVVLDELHKYPQWKRWLKGEYDTHGDRVRFLVTGSARLDIYRKGGDSLQGRYHSHRLHGFSVGEVDGGAELPVPGKEIEFPERYNREALSSLLTFGPFPEPFLKQNSRNLRRWRSQRLDRFFREDVRDLENVRNLASLELLADMLEGRVGSLLSLQSLREDLEVSHRAVTHWMEILDRLYFSFRIHPYSHTAVRSLKKAPKAYLWEYSAVMDKGARFENLVASHLLKLKHALEDQEGFRVGLHFLRDASKREVDFLVALEGRPWFAVECKLSGRKVNPALNYFGESLEIPFLYQITMEQGADIQDGRVRVMPAGKFLAALP